MPDVSVPGRGPLLRALLVTYALFAALAPVDRFPSVCPFLRTTGRRCPLCGLTRATRALARGEVRDGLAMHPLAPVLWIAAIVALARH